MLQRGLLIVLGLFSLTFASTAFAAFPEDYLVQATTGSLMPVAQTDTAMSAIDPAAHITRAEFVALIVEKLYTQQDLDRCYWDISSKWPPHFTLVFTDVHVNDRFAKHICVAMRDGFIRGYGDGSFRPNKAINFAEAGKVLSRAFALAPYADYDRFSPWYRLHAKALAERGAIPTSISGLNHLMTAGESSEMLSRLMGGIVSRPSRTYEELEPKPIPPRKPAAVQKPTPSSASAQSSSAHSSAASSASSSSKGSLWDFF